MNQTTSQKGEKTINRLVSSVINGSNDERRPKMYGYVQDWKSSNGTCVFVNIRSNDESELKTAEVALQNVKKEIKGSDLTSNQGKDGLTTLTLKVFTRTDVDVKNAITKFRAVVKQLCKTSGRVHL